MLAQHSLDLHTEPKYAVNKNEDHVFWYIINCFKNLIIGTAWRTDYAQQKYPLEPQAA